MRRTSVLGILFLLSLLAGGCALGLKPKTAKRCSRLSFEEASSLPTVYDGFGAEQWQTVEHFSSQLGRKVPVIYGNQWAPIDPQFDKGVIDGLIKSATEHAPEGQSIWFIWVGHAYFTGVNEQGFFLLSPRGLSRHSDLVLLGGKIEIGIYFTPSTRDRRIRKGRYLHSRRDILDVNDVAEADLDPGAYCQVSSTRCIFGDSLDTPRPGLHPFQLPEGFTDEEIVKIVDLIGTTEPSTTIIEKPDGRIAVRTQREGLLGGSSGECYLRRTADGFDRVGGGGAATLL